MLKLRQDKKYLGKVIEWDTHRRRGTVVTSWGLVLPLHADEILSKHGANDDALFYVVFRKRQAQTIFIGSAAA